MIKIYEHRVGLFGCNIRSCFVVSLDAAIRLFLCQRDVCKFITTDKPLFLLPSLLRHKVTKYITWFHPNQSEQYDMFNILLKENCEGIVSWITMGFSWNHHKMATGCVLDCKQKKINHHKNCGEGSKIPTKSFDPILTLRLEAILRMFFFFLL